MYLTYYLYNVTYMCVYVYICVYIYVVKENQNQTEVKAVKGAFIQKTLAVGEERLQHRPRLSSHNTTRRSGNL